MTIFNMISVNALERFGLFNSNVKRQFKFIHDRFWTSVSNDPHLSNLHHLLVYDECPRACDSLFEAYIEHCQKSLSAELFIDLTKDFDSLLLQQQIVNLESLDINPLTKEAVYAAMEHADDQHEIECRMSAYRNEY